MPKLVARGPEDEELRFRLRADREVLLGRRPDATQAGDSWAVTWESKLSRNHARLTWRQGRLQVERLEAAKNPVFFEGAEQDSFLMEVGEHFVIGSTSFSLSEDRASVAHEDPTPLDIVGYTVAELRETRYQDAHQRLEVLAGLPEVIRGVANDEELFSRLVVLLFEGIASAQAAAIVSLAGDEKVDVFFWDSRTPAKTELKPSRRLIVDAVKHRKQSVRSLWSESAGESPDYTIAEALDWAFCTPVPGTACAGWGLYVAGKSGDAGVDLRPDIKFTELVADLLGAMRDFQSLQHQQVTLGRFFSPVTLPMLSSPEGEKALEPRQTDVTVLFCDLRGFSREAERARDDLMGLLQRVSHALDVMTHCIHSHQGVIGDFQGDAALAFWGWPIGGDQVALQACRAALDIRQRFEDASEQQSDPLFGFRCGIGIASGEAVAGRLGSAGQFKIDVFGPVVNLASRLEGITKQLRVPLLVDDATVDKVSSASATSSLELPRFRRLARLRPYGMQEPVTVSEILPDSGEANVLDAEGVAHYERALDAFVKGDWAAAFALLHEVPHWDQGKDFLTSHILKHQRTPPPGWDGVVPMDRK